MLPDALTSDPRLYAAFVAVLIAALVIQHAMGWRTYRQIHRGKTTLLPLLETVQRARIPLVQRFIPSGLLLISRKGYRDDAEFLVTIDDDVRGVWQTLVDAGGSPHLVSSIKERPHPDGGEQLSAAHVVWLHSDGTQTEAYLFVAPDEEGTDVYAHGEPSVTDPEAHLSGKQTDGDPRDVVWDALIEAYAVEDDAE